LSSTPGFFCSRRAQASTGRHLCRRLPASSRLQLDINQGLPDLPDLGIFFWNQKPSLVLPKSVFLITVEKSRHSSVVEQLIRNQQARGSNPRAGSREIKGLAAEAGPIFVSGYQFG
jgi:hypothetical protein